MNTEELKKSILDGSILNLKWIGRVSFKEIEDAMREF